MAETTLKWNLIADDKASPVLGKLGQSMDKASGVASKLGKVAAGLGAAFAVGSIIDFGKGLVQAAEDGIKAQAALSNVTESMGLFGDDAAKVADRLSALADAQARATGVDDDAIRATQTKLMTFKEVAGTADEMGGMFDRATTAALDLAAAGFGTAEANAVQLGKALNDPVAGISALAKSGVTFTAAEKDMIAGMVEAGNMAGAQEVIMKALETQVGGTAAASATSSDKMRVKWEQLQGTLGEKLLPIIEAVQGFIGDKLLPVIEQVAGFIGDTLVPAFGIFWQALTGNSEVNEFDGHLRTINNLGVALGDWIQRASTFVTGTLVPALTSLGQWIVKNRDWLSALAIAIGAGVIAWKAYTTAITVWKAITAAASAAQVVFNAVLSANPIGLIITAIAALVAGLVWFFTKTELGQKIWAGFTDFLSTAWERIKVAFSLGWEGIKRFLGMAWDLIKRVWSFSPLGLIVTNWDKILQFFKDIPGKIGGFFSNLGDTIMKPFKSAFNTIAGWWNNSVGKLSFTVPEWLPGGGNTFGVPKIPTFFRGGVMPFTGLASVGEYGPEQVVLPAGARVLPSGVASNRASGDGTVRLHPDDLAALAAMVIDGARRAARGEISAVGTRVGMGVV